jgi:hypothetical protein
MSFALALAPLRKGSGPTAVIEGRPVPVLTPDTRTLKRIEFPDVQMPPIVLSAAQADTTFAVGFVSRTPLAGDGIQISRFVWLPPAATFVGKTFRFELQGPPTEKCALDLFFDGNPFVNGRIQSEEGDSTSMDTNSSTIRIGEGARAGDWFEVFGLTDQHLSVRGVCHFGDSGGSTPLGVMLQGYDGDGVYPSLPA